MPAIPPTEEAVRAAMAPPSRPRGGGRAIVFVALGMIAVGVGGFMMPKPGVTNRDRTSDARVTDRGTLRTHDHSSGFRILMPLAPDRRGNRAELETMIRFSYACLDSREMEARNAIRRNWTATARSIGAEIAKHSRLGIVMELEPLTARLHRSIEETMFGGGEATIESVGWEHLTFR